MRLVGRPDAPRLVRTTSGVDHSERMRSWARSRVDQLAQVGLHGFVFKKDSPSSSLLRVKIYDENGNPSRTGVGLFAAAVSERFPLLPTEEEGRLHDMHLRESFIDRVFAYYRWTNLLQTDPTPGGLVRFHTAQKLTLMAHSPNHYRTLGRLVARVGTLPWEEVEANYGARLMEGLQVMTSPGKHANVLQHVMGYLRDELSPEDKAELVGLIDDYRGGTLPLIVPLTILRHHLNRHGVPEWVRVQAYVNPYPKQLLLRNHI